MIEGFRFAPKGHRGFTLIEIIIVMGILIIVSGLTLVVSMDSYRNYNFRSQQYLLAGLLQKARMQSMDNINQRPHGVYIQQSPPEYVLFQGPSYVLRDASEDVVFPGSGGYAVSGLAEAVFSQLSGSVQAPGVIVLNDGIYPIFKISLNQEGQIDEQ